MSHPARTKAISLQRKRSIEQIIVRCKIIRLSVELEFPNLEIKISYQPWTIHRFIYRCYTNHAY